MRTEKLEIICCSPIASTSPVMSFAANSSAPYIAYLSMLLLRKRQQVRVKKITCHCSCHSVTASSQVFSLSSSTCTLYKLL
jgi:hypothetical protein